MKEGLVKVCNDSRGNQLWVEDNEVGGRRYWSDDIGGGVCIYDTSLASREMLLLALKHEHDLYVNELSSDGWVPIGPGMPLGVWLETKREYEKGHMICMARLLSLGDEVEWLERGDLNPRKPGQRMPGRTTVTHSTFAAPTHWRWPLEQTA
jgi:hypothetical protein